MGIFEDFKRFYDNEQNEIRISVMNIYDFKETLSASAMVRRMILDTMNLIVDQFTTIPKTVAIWVRKYVFKQPF